MTAIQIIDLVMAVLMAVGLITTYGGLTYLAVKDPTGIKAIYQLRIQILQQTPAQYYTSVVAMLGINASYWGAFNYFGFDFCALVTLIGTPVWLIEALLIGYWSFKPTTDVVTA